MSMEEFKERMEYLYQRVVNSDKMVGVDHIYTLEELEQLTQEERTQSGIPCIEAEIQALNEEAQRVGLFEIEVSNWEEPGRRKEWSSIGAP